ncbi:MAG: hypothetical protein JNK04_22075 [Myxococcales bacterium]|nr:hypothetical protein [Myxococcales bacterium]
MDRNERAAFRKLVADVLTAIEQRDAMKLPAEQGLWAPFIAQLRHLQTLIANDGEPSLAELARITVGHMALREIAEEPEDVPPDLLPLWKTLHKVQTGVMSYYAPFP